MYELIKNLNFEKIKPLAISAVCFAVVFIAGFGAGKLYSGTGTTAPTKRTLSNYTTNTNAPAAPEVKIPANNPTNSTENNCYIKGSKSKIYHMPGGSFYDRTNAAQCFATEGEAQAAGFTKSSR